MGPKDFVLNYFFKICGKYFLSFPHKKPLTAEKTDIAKCFIFIFWVIKLTKTPILPNYQVPNGFLWYNCKFYDYNSKIKIGFLRENISNIFRAIQASKLRTSNVLLDWIMLLKMGLIFVTKYRNNLRVCSFLSWNLLKNMDTRPKQIQLI